MNAWDQYWHGAVSAVRPWLLQRVVLLLLAFDTWLVMLEHGGRYGVGDFNVAHFGWLGAIQPMPTPGLYVGSIAGCGILAFALAVTRPNRLLLGLLTGMYTWGWAMSMLDSYQHHYLLSLLLLSCTFFPRSTSLDWFSKSSGFPVRKRGPYLSAWPYATFGTTCAIVYGYAGLSKLETDWRQGNALRRLTSDNEFVQSLQQLLGASGGAFWEWLAMGAIVTQLLLCIAYVAAVRRDTPGDAFARGYCGVMFVAALGFHIGAELLGLQIGWFSYYMMAIAGLFFAPERILWMICWVAGWPVRTITELSGGDGGDEGTDVRVLGGVSLVAAVLIAVLGHMVDLPGVLTMCILVGVGLAIAVFVLLHRGRLQDARRWLVAFGSAAVVMWGAIALSEVRFDYYRLVGGDARRRGELEKALSAYTKANEYAPADDDRREKERELRRRLGRPEK
jgi:hypothetical protein